MTNCNAEFGRHVANANGNVLNVCSPSFYHDALKDLSPNGSVLSSALSRVSGHEEQRKRGRPRIREIVIGPKRPRGRPHTKEVVLGPKRPPGRPRKHTIADPPPIRRRRGRPPKVKGSGGVIIEFGKYTMPALSSTLCQSSHRVDSEPAHIRQPAIVRAPLFTNSDASSMAHTQEIISEGDPEHSMDPEDDDTETGEAYGDEDEDADDGDEKDDEDELGGEHGQPTSSDKPPRIRRLPPPWLLQAFKACIKDLEIRDPQGLPSLYANSHTFWHNPSSSYFALRKADISPSVLYNPRFFVWDPQSLFKDLPCPNCKKVLHRHAVISHPRRCVDISSTFWIIGFRYRCRHCRNPRTQKIGTLTWRSWDPRILASLPSELAAEFPAKLSHRSAISIHLFSWMRSCFQNGMSTKQFATAVRVQHLLQYDQLHLQYLNFLANESGLHRWSGRKFKSFRPFTDRSDDGFHGYIPSAQWFRDIYDQFIEEHRDDFNQHTAMLTANICAIDHSHKITKHIARVGGERVFNGLLTFTNEKGEIRVCNLVATKAHSQFESALNCVRESLNMFGHSPPEVVYTDNLSDKSFLESIFPSLRKNVTPIEKYSHLEPFLLPSSVLIHIRRDERAIDTAMRNIIDIVPTDETEPDLVVGFDTEWNFTVSDDGRCEKGDIAVIQIAYGTDVYILQISDLIAHQRLPAMLLMVLQNPRIRKVGRMVSSDLKQLQELVGSPILFPGALDVAKFAKDRHIVSNAKCSLSDLCAIVLAKCLRKNVSERTSMAWEQPALSAEQAHYAACDAYAALLVYQELSKISPPKPLPTSLIPMTPVLLYNTDNTTIVASGHLSPNIDVMPGFDGINLTATRTLVEVTDVLVPAAIISSHSKRSLKSFGSTPFHLVCLRSHLRIFDPLNFHLPNFRQTTTQSFQSGPSQTVDLRSPVTLDVESVDHELETDYATSDGAGTLLRDSLCADDLDPESSGTGELVARNTDTESLHYGQQMLQGINTGSWNTTLRSRVLKDPFHVFNMLRLSATHSLRKEFARALRDVLFVPDQEDRRRISIWLSVAKPPRTFEQVQMANPSWLWKHCRRIIPPPEVLFPLVEKLFLVYGSLKDVLTELPLFNKANWKIAKQILEMIRQGFLSDPPGIPLYTQIGIDSKAGGLPIYRCCRGTNFTEGGVHTHLRSHLPTSGASVRHANASLYDFVLQHNLRVGTFNSTGQAYQSHFSIWLTNQLQERLVFLNDILIDPLHITGWVNGNLYLPTSERLGILPVSRDTQQSSGMAAFNPNLDQKQHHAYLASMQGTHKAILPLHTPAEHDLFRLLMRTHPTFNTQSTGPVWKLAVKVWNEHADREVNIFYKLIEHLKAYYKLWETNLNIRQSLSVTSTARHPVLALARNPSRSLAADPLSERTRTLHNVTEGFNMALLATVQPQGGLNGLEPAPMDHVNISSPQTLSNALANQRVANDIAMLRPDQESRKRKRRTCAKCACLTCPGSQRVKNCTNPCQDCGQVNCRGRNSKRPIKPCRIAWDD